MQNCIFGDGVSSLSGSADSAYSANYNPGSGSPVTFIDTVLTGYTVALGFGTYATRAQQVIDAPLSVTHCVLHANGTDVDPDLAADDGYGAAVNDTFGFDPLLGAMDGTDRAAWAIGRDRHASGGAGTGAPSAFPAEGSAVRPGASGAILSNRAARDSPAWRDGPWR